MSTNTKECQFCCSQIPEKATKCKYCMEWQEEENNNISESSSRNDLYISDSQKVLRKPFQLKIIENIPFHYVVSVFIICVLLFGVVQFFWYRLDENKIYLLSFLTFAVQMMISWAGLIWIYKIINNNYASYIQISPESKENASNMYIKHNNRIFNNTNSILVGIVVGAVASAGDYMVGTPFVTFQAKMVFAVFEFINMFFAGAAIYSMLMYALFVHKISEEVNESSLRLDCSDSISRIGKIHLKTSILAIVPLFLGVIAKLFGNWSWELMIILWYGSFALAIVVYIYWPMLNIHRIMKKDLERQTTLIQKKLQETLIDINTSQSVRSVVRLNELRELEKSIMNEPTWPFDPKSISAAFFAIVFPILLMIIDKIWSF